MFVPNKALPAVLALLSVACGGSPQSPSPPVPVPKAIPAAPAPAPPPPKADPCTATPGEVETVRVVPNLKYLTADEREIVWTDGYVVQAMAEGQAPRVLGRYEGSEELSKLKIAGDRVFALANRPEPGRKSCGDQIVAFPRRGGTATKLVEGSCLRDFDVAIDRVVYMRDLPNGLGASGALATTTFAGVTSTLFEQLAADRVDVHGARAFLSLRSGELDSIPWNDTVGTRIFDGRVEDAQPGFHDSVVAIDDRTVYVGVRHPEYTAITIVAVDHDEEVEPRQIGVLLEPSRGSESPWPRGGLTQDATHLVWPVTFRGRVVRLAKSGACPVEDLAVWRIAPDFAVPSGKFVYWREKSGADATIVRRRVAP